MKNIIQKAIEQDQYIVINSSSLPNTQVKDTVQPIPDNCNLIVIKPSFKFIDSILPCDYIIELRNSKHNVYELVNSSLMRNKETNIMHEIIYNDTLVMNITNEPNNINFVKALNAFNKGKTVKINDQYITTFNYSSAHKIFHIESFGNKIEVKDIENIEIINEYRDDYELMTLFKNNVDTHSFVLVGEGYEGVYDVIDVSSDEVTMLNKVYLYAIKVPRYKLNKFKIIKMELK